MKNLPAKKPNKSVKKGDIFLLGNHVLGCGNCCDKDFVAKILDQRKISLVCSDPPFGVAMVESAKGFKTPLKNKVIQGDHLQSDEEYEKFTRNWICALKPHLARKNSFYIFNSDKMIFALRQAILVEGLKFAQLLIWLKTSAVVGRLDYAPQHELVAFGWYGAHSFQKPKDKSVLICPKPKKSPFHPSTKPLSLIRRLVLNSTALGDVVYDGFLGSGTCLLVCEQTKRICVGIEIDEEYCQTAIDRWQALTDKTAEFIGNYS